MTTSEKFPFLFKDAPVYFDAHTVISEVVNSSGFEGLINSTFDSIEVFAKGMTDCGWNISYREFKKNVVNKEDPSQNLTTYHAELIDKGGAKWWLGLQSYGPHYMKVFNVVKMKEGFLPEETPTA